MIAGIVEYLESIIGAFGVWGVFLAAFVEEVVAPLPSPLVMTASGFFLLEGPFSLDLFLVLILLVAIPYAIGVTLGSFILYGLLYHFGETAVRSWGRWFGISWKEVETFQGRLRRTRWDDISLLFFRVVPLIPSAALAAASGFVRMPIIRYTFITLIGVSIRAALFATLGWYAGSAYYQYAEQVAEFESIATFIFVGVCIAGVAYLIFRAHRKRGEYDKIRA